MVKSAFYTFLCNEKKLHLSKLFNLKNEKMKLNDLTTI